MLRPCLQIKSDIKSVVSVGSSRCILVSISEECRCWKTPNGFNLYLDQFQRRIYNPVEHLRWTPPEMIRKPYVVL